MGIASRGREHAWRESRKRLGAIVSGGRDMGITVLVVLLLTMSGLRVAAVEPSPPEPDTLRVSAIAWFAEPARRVVVINDTVLKQGESLGPFTVMDIRPAEVEIAYPGGLFVKTVVPVSEEREPTPARQENAPSSPLDPPPSAARGLRYHEVRAGENLFRIGMQYQLTVDTLRRLNNLPDEVTIVKPGQRLVVGPVGDP